MPLTRAEAMFKVVPSKLMYKQKVKLRPIEHHYESKGEEPYIKYSCQLCEQIAEHLKDFTFDEKGYVTFEGDEERLKFNNFLFAEGTEQCPCCGVNIDWDYKHIEEKWEVEG